MSKFLLKNRFISLLAHLSAWGIFLSIPMLTRLDIGAPSHIKELPIGIVLLFGSLLIFIFYVNFLLLIPRILNRFGTRFYGLSVFVLWGIFMSFTLGFSYECSEFGQRIPVFAPVFPFLLVITLSLSIRLLMDKTQSEQSQKERENEALTSELSFLRSQISPHFLFNIMNNIVALSRIKPDKVEPTLIQLSQFMRYMLYSSDEKKVSIAKEIDYLENYMALQKMRFGDSVDVIFEKKGIYTEGGLIEPMLLIPFVENAFKHGVGFVDNPKINIVLLCIDNVLTFSVSNSFDPFSTATKDGDSGIGLKNVKRRLELLYGDNQTLKITNNDGIFNVNLVIQFNHF